MDTTNHNPTIYNRRDQLPLPRLPGIFVYGTLMSYQRNNKLETYANTPLSPIEGLLFGYKLYRVTTGYPGIVEDKATSAVMGEYVSLQQLTHDNYYKLLEHLNSYEGFPGLYCLHKVSVRVDTDLGTDYVWAYTYVYGRPISKDMPEGQVTHENEVTIYQW